MSDTGVFARLLSHNRVVLATAAMVAAAGAVAWATMPREEDPRLPDRFGLLVVPVPGADAEAVERQVVAPLEDELSSVAEIKHLDMTARGEVVVGRIQLHDRVTDTDRAWDEVEDAIADARREFPDGVLAHHLDTAIMGEQEAIVLAVTGAGDPLALLDAARVVEDRLLRVDGVAQVRLIGDPGEQVTIEWDDALAKRVGIAPSGLVQQLAARNQTIPAGTVRIGDRVATLAPRSELQSMGDLARTPIALPSGAAVPLGDLATVRMSPVEPAVELMRYRGQRGVAIGVVAEPDLDVVALGGRVRAAVADVRADIAPLELHELSFQPDYVAARLYDLGGSLVLGIGIVTLVLVAFMGFRIGLLVASVVPVVAMTSLAVYALGGGVLQQLSVAALILSLGLLVDNAIVIVEATQYYLDQGESRATAAIRAVRELAIPLLTATGTTVAAFIPMAIADGAVGDFTRAIPVVAIITLVMSYVFAVLVTPILAALVLRQRDRGARPMLARPLEWLSRAGVSHPIASFALAIAIVGGSIAAAAQLPLSFFPKADRNQLVVEIALPEGAHLSETDATSRALEQFLLDRTDILAVSSFVGRSAPSFYYNLPRRPQAPHFAHVLIVTRERGDVGRVLRAVQAFGRAELAHAEILPRRLEQGPPLRAPVEVRLYGDDLESLYAGAATTIAALRAIPGTRNVRHDLGTGRPTVSLAIDDAAAARRGLSRADIALGLRKQTRGLAVGQLRSGAEPVPIVVRSGAGENLDPTTLSSIETAAPAGGFVPLAQLGALAVDWRPAAIHRRDGRRVVTVSAQLDDGLEYGPVLDALAPRLDDELPAHYAWEWGGAAEGSTEANANIAAGAPIGAILLVFFILIEFNSFRRLAIILTTVPLAAAGVFPGLLLGGQPFGFMALLGVFALIGVVVNNAIVLVSVVDARRADGIPVEDAVAAAVKLRARPILLTAATTVAGLTPLAMSSSPLWPPMAWAMIAGVSASTVLTLVVIPALYALLFRDRTASGRPLGELGE